MIKTRTSLKLSRADLRKKEKRKRERASVTVDGQGADECKGHGRMGKGRSLICKAIGESLRGAMPM